MFKVLQIDHVELFVPDRYDAAKWYARVLGLQIVPECEPWAAGGGPLMISSDGGSTSFGDTWPESSPTTNARRIRRLAVATGGNRVRMQGRRRATTPAGLCCWSYSKPAGQASPGW